jgi:hypothetical protein
MALKFRRGSTAQQSGSLAFGEPYVNTTLGTLVIGGATGDIVLSAGGTGSTGNFGAISGSGLDITGNANIAGNLTLGGAITIGDATADTVNVVASLSSSLIPQTTNAFDLGSATKIWRDLYISTGSIKFVEGNSVVKTLSAATLTALETSTNGAATTGSNTFNGTQTVSGSINLTGRITAALAVSASGLNINKADGNVTIELANSTTGRGFHLQSYNGDVFSIHHPTSGLSIFRIESGSQYSTHHFGDVTVLSGSMFSAGGFTGSIAATNGVVSGSSQVVFNTISNNPFSQSASSVTVSKHIIPTTLTLDLGSAEKPFRDLYLSSASLYINGTSVLSSNATELILSTETGQSIKLNELGTDNITLQTVDGDVELKSSGDGDILLDPTNGKILLKGPVEILNGQKIQSSVGGTPVVFANDIAITGSITTTGNINGFNLTTLSQRIDANEAVSGTFARTNSTNIFNGTQTVSGSLIVTQNLTVLGSSSIQNISSSNLVIGAALVTLNTATPGARFAGLTIIDSGSVGGSGSFLYDAVEDEFVFVHRGNGTNITSSHFVLGPATYDNLGNEIYLTTNKIPKASGLEHIVDSNITDNGTLITLGSNAVVNGTFYATGTTLVSGSSQITYSGLSGIPAGIVSGSSQLSSILPAGVVSGSSQITGLSNVQLTNSSTTIGTTAIALGASSTTLAGLTSVTSTAFVGALTGNASTVTTNANLTGNVTSVGNATTIAAGVVTDAMLAGSISNAKLTNSTISGISLGSNLATLTIGTGLSGTSYNGSGAVTIANTGVLSNVAGTGVTVSGGTGNVTISIGQAVATTSNVQFGSIGVGMAANGTSGRIDAANDIVAFSSSDIRFKENITPIENALDKISKISGNTYDWKAENKAEHGYEGNDVGVIAQEIEAVLPQLVQTRENGFKAVKYDKLVALLIEGIKEQQIQIEELKAQIGSK